MNDDDPQTIKRMLQYLYTLDYPEDDVPFVRADHAAMDGSLSPPLLHNTSTITEHKTDSITTLGLFEGASSHDPKMMNNAIAYATAEKYDIPELKELAKRKFQTLASSKWPHNNFYAVTEAVFSTTPDEDMGLRQIVIDICGKHFRDILKDEESRAAFLNNKAVAVAVLDTAVRMNDQYMVLLGGAQAKHVTLAGELSKAKADMQIALDQKDAWSSRLDSLFQRANGVQKCRHCHKKFQWNLERLEAWGGLGMQLRCEGCRTKEVL